MENFMNTYIVTFINETPVKITCSGFRRQGDSLDFDGSIRDGETFTFYDIPPGKKKPATVVADFRADSVLSVVLEGRALPV
jgi:hypothetical protein